MYLFSPLAVEPFAQGVSYTTDASIPSYKIIYLLLGGLAIIVGIAVLLWMPDSPTNAHMLSHEERIAAIERIRDDQGGTENRKLKKEQLIEALTDFRTWLIVLSTLLSKSPPWVCFSYIKLNGSMQQTFPTEVSQIV